MATYTVRGKNVVQNLDDEERNPSGAAYQIQMLGCVFPFQGQWASLLAEQEPPLIRNPQHDPENPSDARDPLGLFDIGTDNGDGTITPIPDNEKLELASQFFVNQLTKAAAIWVSMYEAESSPVDAAEYLVVAKKNQGQKGRNLANSVYAQVEPVVNGGIKIKNKKPKKEKKGK